MPQDRRTATYKVLNANSPVIENLLRVKENSEGYRCQVFFPVASDSVFGDLDQVMYRKKPDLDKLFVCLSAVQESWAGTQDSDQVQQYDPFLQDPPQILTTKKGQLPKLSKVILYYNEGVRMFRVAYHRSYDGATPYMIRNILQPLS